MWDTSISLPVSKTETQDAAGFPQEDTGYLNGIPANSLDVTRNDQILANQMGYTADIIIEIDAAAYSGQGFFVDESTGDIYDIRRTFRKNKSSRIQLTGKLRKNGKV